MSLQHELGGNAWIKDAGRAIPRYKLKLIPVKMQTQLYYRPT